MSLLRTVATHETFIHAYAAGCASNGSGETASLIEYCGRPDADPDVLAALCGHPHAGVAGMAAFASSTPDAAASAFLDRDDADDAVLAALRTSIPAAGRFAPRLELVEQAATAAAGRAEDETDAHLARVHVWQSLLRNKTASARTQAGTLLALDQLRVPAPPAPHLLPEAVREAMPHMSFLPLALYAARAITAPTAQDVDALAACVQRCGARGYDPATSRAALKVASCWRGLPQSVLRALLALSVPPPELDPEDAEQVRYGPLPCPGSCQGSTGACVLAWAAHLEADPSLVTEALDRHVWAASGEAIVRSLHPLTVFDLPSPAREVALQAAYGSPRRPDSQDHDDAWDVAAGLLSEADVLSLAQGALERLWHEAPTVRPVLAALFAVRVATPASLAAYQALAGTPLGMQVTTPLRDLLDAAEAMASEPATAR